MQADAGEMANHNLADPPCDSLVLMWNRLNVLIASSRSRLLPHRLRVSGVPTFVKASHADGDACPEHARSRASDEGPQVGC